MRRPESGQVILNQQVINSKSLCAFGVGCAAQMAIKTQPVEMLLLFTVRTHSVWVRRPLTGRWEAISAPDGSVWTEAPCLSALKRREGRGDAGDPADG